MGDWLLEKVEWPATLLDPPPLHWITSQTQGEFIYVTYKL